MAITVRGSTPLIQVYDMPTSIRYYRDVLGFVLVDQSPPELGDDCDWAMLSLNDERIMLNTAYDRERRPSSPDPSRMAAHQDTIIFFGCPDVDGAFDYFISKGLNPAEPFLTQYGYKALSLSDPDGYGLTFHWPVT